MDRGIDAQIVLFNLFVRKCKKMGVIYVHPPYNHPFDEEAFLYKSMYFGFTINSKTTKDLQCWFAGIEINEYPIFMIPSQWDEALEAIEHLQKFKTNEK